MPFEPEAADLPLEERVSLLRRADEDRWMASRFAAAPVRAALEAAYAVNHEIASVAELVREPGLGAIRLQWWREGLEAIAAGASPPREPALQALSIAAPQVAGVLAALTDA
ncbi:MAG TPA: squalene/phytoene synthase family protein, partial [Terricaulis sp.]|nr:squalene/phytoene synthase family protein [Terricaulis sp.]